MNIYQRIEPTNPRILNTIGQLFGERKGDFNNAVQYHTRALKLQEEVNDFISIVTLFSLIDLFYLVNQSKRINEKTNFY